MVGFGHRLDLTEILLQHPLGKYTLCNTIVYSTLAVTLGDPLADTVLTDRITVIRDTRPTRARFERLHPLPRHQRAGHTTGGRRAGALVQTRGQHPIIVSGVKHGGCEQACEQERATDASTQHRA